MPVPETRPRAIPKSCWRNEQCPLPPVFYSFTNQFSADEGLAETDGICDQDPVVLFEDSFGPEDSVRLECGQVDTRSGSGLLFQFPVITLPENTEVDQVRVVFFKPGLVD